MGPGREFLGEPRRFTLKVHGPTLSGLYDRPFDEKYPSVRRVAYIGKIDTVVDIRSTPRSSTNPQFNFDALPQALAPWHMGYTQIMELGGRRRKSTSIAPAVNAFWMHQSFHNYADHALSDEFRSGLTRLLELSAVRRCALMCSESLWWRCHRDRPDYLLIMAEPSFTSWVPHVWCRHG